MKRIIVVALAVLGVCMAATASAPAHEFHASKLGTLLGLSTTSQIFTTSPEGGNEVTCKHAATTGSITALLALFQLVSVRYTGCTALLGTKVDITPANYSLSADGLAAIENTITITALPIIGGPCTITVHPQDLGTVKFATKGTEIIEESAVKGILSLSSGEPCGTAGTHTGGTYTGTNLVFEDGGSLSWT